MTYDMISEFMNELAFLALVGAITAIVCSAFVRDPWLALFFASGFSTLLLNLWAYITVGTIDIPFVVQVFVISTAMAIPIISIIDGVRARRAAPA